jgi:hypothetical protein
MLSLIQHLAGNELRLQHNPSTKMNTYQGGSQALQTPKKADLSAPYLPTKPFYT